jgi:hypothetical protein
MPAISCGVISEHAVRGAVAVPGPLWVIAGVAPACASIAAVSTDALIAEDIVVLLGNRRRFAELLSDSMH